MGEYLKDSPIWDIINKIVFDTPSGPMSTKPVKKDVDDPNIVDVEIVEEETLYFPEGDH